MRIIINTEFGGFSLSEEAVDRLGITTQHPYNKDFGITSENDYEYRSSSKLLQLIDAIGIDAVGGKWSKLKIVEIPDGINWTIEEYDGKEWIAEDHRTWS